LLGKNGVLFVEVPCLDYQFKEVDEPHLLFFDKPSLDNLLYSFQLSGISTSYHGKPIKSRQGISMGERMVRAVRHRLLARGIHYPFSRKRPGLECVEPPLERAIVAPFLAHVEQDVPSWWLRALATKP